LQTALGAKSDWGTVEITHPFHPLRGQRFAVLKRRVVSGVETLIVRGGSEGTRAVPAEWTDRAAPPLYAELGTGPRVLEPASLLELAGLVASIAGSNKELDK
jgi:hypothetical protein